MSTARTSKYVVTDLQMSNPDPKVESLYATYAKRVLRMDKNIVEGAFHMETAWYVRSAPTGIQDKPHVHDGDEIICFFGSDPDNPYDLGGEIEIWLDDERHVIDRTAMIFVPAGMKHCPLNVLRVDRPIFHFIAVAGKEYTKG